MDVLTSGNVNEIRQGIWQISSVVLQDVSNLPVDTTGILWVPFYKSGFWSLQIYITYTSGALSDFYYRIGSGSAYFDWIKLAKAQ